MRLIFVAFLFSLVFSCAKAQIISTFAGGCDTCTSIGDGRPATDAVVLDPNGGAFDKVGNFFFAENTGHRVRRVDTSGIITTIAGTGVTGSSGDGGQATEAAIGDPSAVALDSMGNVYIAETTQSVIRKVNSTTGIISTIAGTGSNGYSGDGGPATAAEIWGPQDICMDRKGNLYIADQVNIRVRKISPAGIITTYAGTGGFSATGTGDGGPATLATFNFIFGIAVDEAGILYIADHNAGKVRKVDTAGMISTFAGNGNLTYIGDGVPATSAQIDPIKLAVDDTGQLVIADDYNLRIYKVGFSGFIHNIAADGIAGFSGDEGPATAAEINYPAGLSFDPCWNLYIADVNNERIRKVSFNPLCNPTALQINSVFDAATVDLFPNPFADVLNVTSPTPISEVSIVDFLGRTIIYEQFLDTRNTEINTANLPDGIYFVTIVDERDNKAIRKIVKQ